MKINGKVLSTETRKGWTEIIVVTKDKVDAADITGEEVALEVKGCADDYPEAKYGRTYTHLE